MEPEAHTPKVAPPTPEPWRESPWLAPVVIAITLGVLALTIVAARDRLRSSVQEQIAARDAVVLHAVAMMPSLDVEAADVEEPIEDPSTQLALLLRVSQLRGVLAARLFNAQGEFVQSFPPNVRDGELTAEDQSRLVQLKPVSRFHPRLPVAELLWSPAEENTSPPHPDPILEVTIPLHARDSTRMAGSAQFWIHGQSVADEFGRLEVHLNRQALAAFGVSGGLLSLVIGVAFHRLRRTHRMLEHRTRDVLQANQELVQAAKTSAVGAVTSHLIHELKNPLAGLSAFVTSGTRNESPALPEQWNEARQATQRMQSMIAEIITLLREEQSTANYQLSLSEITELVERRLTPAAVHKKVRLKRVVHGELDLGNRIANLVILILTHLGHNAVHATPSERSITLNASEQTGACWFSVRDSGPGFPPDASSSLFQPRPSTHDGGSGLGLAICKQLANHLGATLELTENSPSGCLFTLKLPLPKQERQNELSRPAPQ